MAGTLGKGSVIYTAYTCSIVNDFSLKSEFVCTTKCVSVDIFLAIGDEASPGNYGMFDQVMALEWVRDNIAGTKFISCVVQRNTCTSC